MISSNFKAVRLPLQTKNRHSVITMWLMHLKCSKDETRDQYARPNRFSAAHPPIVWRSSELSMPSRSSNSNLEAQRKSVFSLKLGSMILNFIETCVTLTPIRSRRVSEEISIY